MSRILGVHTPSEMKNLAINGALDFWQEKANVTTTVNAAVNTTYAADMVRVSFSGSTNKNYSYVRSTDVPTFAQAGFQAPYSLLFTMLTGIASPAAGDYQVPWFYSMEGLDYAKIHGRIVTYGFWIKASIAGTYSFAAQNGNSTRSYVTTFTVNNANTYEFKSITIPMDNTGTWNFDTTAGLNILIGSISGTTYQTSTLNQWQAGNFITSTTSTNFMATTNATLRLSMFSIVEGSQGFGATGFQRAGKTVQQELAMCQRYYEKSYELDTTIGTATTSAVDYRPLPSGAAGNPVEMHWFKVTKRAQPTVTFYNPTTGGTGTWRGSDTTNYALSFNTLNQNNFSSQLSVSPSAGIAIFGHWVVDARI